MSNGEDHLNLRKDGRRCIVFLATFSDREFLDLRSKQAKGFLFDAVVQG